MYDVQNYINNNKKLRCRRENARRSILFRNVTNEVRNVAKLPVYKCIQGHKDYI